MSRDVAISRRGVLAGGAATAGLAWAGLLGAGCARHVTKDPFLRGRTGGAFGDWSLISPRDELIGKIRRYDVVIVGSGYGGAVTAARLAQAGAKVCVLERGQEWLPGDFPEDLVSMMSADRSVDAHGLIDLYAPTDSDMDIVSASGVGGTSLINAAISTRPEAHVFDQDEWPGAIREAYQDGTLGAHYDRAEAVLSPRPMDEPELAKVALHRTLTAKRGGGTFAHLPLNITQRDEVRGAPRRPVRQYACRRCGNCTTGCNFGAKGTLQASYLPAAVAAGARIFAGIEVLRVGKQRNGWRVHFLVHSERDSRAGAIEADRVIVAGGSLGSTEILMRSGAGGLKLSEALGTRVSANGDVLGLCYAGDAVTSILGERKDATTGRVGAALTSYADYRGDARGPSLQDRFLLIEGTIPVALSNTVAKVFGAYAALHGRGLSGRQLSLSQLDLADPDAPHPEGALAHSTLYLACGHDDSGGRYVYRSGERPRIVWPGVGRSRFVEAIYTEMEAYAQLQSGWFVRNPRGTLFDGRIMAPHPLGGCPMAETVGGGVVDHQGRVFDPGGSGTHRGLYVLDGSIIPRSLAATPLLTICALAERAAEGILAAS